MRSKINPEGLAAFNAEVERLESLSLKDEEKILLLNNKFNVDYKKTSYKHLKKRAGFVEKIKKMKKNQAICKKWEIPDPVPEPLNYADKLALLMEGKITQEEFENE